MCSSAMLLPHLYFVLVTDMLLCNLEDLQDVMVLLAMVSTAFRLGQRESGAGSAPDPAAHTGCRHCLLPRSLINKKSGLDQIVWLGSFKNPQCLFLFIASEGRARPAPSNKNIMQATYVI